MLGRLPDEHLLNAYLAGTVDEEAFHMMTAELRSVRVTVEKELTSPEGTANARGNMGLRFYDWCQALPTLGRR